jgi:hypothetical protein
MLEPDEVAEERTVDCRARQFRTIKESVSIQRWSSLNATPDADCVILGLGKGPYCREIWSCVE